MPPKVDDENAGGSGVNETRVQTFSFESFDPVKGKFSRWYDRLEVAFTIYNVELKHQKNMLLHFLGQSTYDKLCDCIQPKKPKDLTLEEITTHLRDYYEPTPLEIVENFKFHSRKQNANESISEFLAELRRLSTHCKFGDFLNTALRNQFVFGLKDDKTQATILAKKDLTLEKAVQIALSIEMSMKGGSIMHTKPTEVNLITQRSKKGKIKTASTTKKTASTNFNNSKNTCYRCGSEEHLANKCPYINTVCSGCKKKGHLHRVCLSSKTDSKKPHTVKQISTINSFEEICQIDSCSENCEKFWMDVDVNNRKVKFELDCGAAVSVMSLKDKHAIFPDLPLQESERNLISFTDNALVVYGQLNVSVRVHNQICKVPLYITNVEKPPIFGRSWIRTFKMDWNKIFEVNSIITTTPNIGNVSQYLETKYSKLFAKDQGKIEGIEAKLEIDPNAKPVFIKARSVPFSIKPIVEKELEFLIESDVLERVNSSRWATPIVAVPKANNRVRICGDYKVTINPHLPLVDSSLPTVDELFEDMAGGEHFSKIDLTQAYLQMEVEEESRECLTLSTPIGLLRPKRLMFGVASAPSTFQREMTKLLGHIPGTKIFIDDVEVSGPTFELHLQRLEEVLKILQDRNMRVNLNKSEFFANQIEYCGYIVDKEGIHKMPSKIKAIDEMPIPKNKDQVRAFAGLINYYRRFFQDLSTVMYPINNLLKNDVKFKWDASCQKSFDLIKRQMQSECFLVHYNPTLPLILATDASPYGVSAVISHKMPDGSERPIQFASQTLNSVQQKYSQIDKEAYAIVFGVKKFYRYLYGRKFILETDNLPVSQIFAPTKSLPTLTATRMQHYAIFLESFNYEIKFRKTQNHANADAFSRLPLPQVSQFSCDEIDVIDDQQISILPVTAKELGELTLKDKTVEKLIEGLKTGRIVDCQDRFTIQQTEFSLKGNCLMRGIRVYVPEKVREKILKELHQAHFGISRTKSLARGYVWWPGLDKDIEIMIKDCNDCQLNQRNPSKVFVHHWQPATAPFQRLHIDFAGEFRNCYFLIIYDAYSKWLEVKVLSNITTETTIKCLREFFAIFGLPSVIVSDRGAQFTSQDFQDFMISNGIVHKMGAPYHPETNGAAERSVQTIKNKLKCLNANSKTMHLELCNILMQYRKTIHPSTGKSPSMMVFNRQMKSRLDLLIPGTEIPREPPVNDANAEISKEIRSFEIHDKILARNYMSKNCRWKKGLVLKRFGKLHYQIKLNDGRIWKRHIDQLRACGKSNSVTNSEKTTSKITMTLPRKNLPVLPDPGLENDSPNEIDSNDNDSQNEFESFHDSDIENNMETVSPETIVIESSDENVSEVGRPRRTKRAPVRYGHT